VRSLPEAIDSQILRDSFRTNLMNECEEIIKMMSEYKIRDFLGALEEANRLIMENNLNLHKILKYTDFFQDLIKIVDRNKPEMKSTLVNILIRAYNQTYILGPKNTSHTYTNLQSAFTHKIIEIIKDSKDYESILEQIIVERSSRMMFLYMMMGKRFSPTTFE
jgi:hypothetical protein